MGFLILLHLYNINVYSGFKQKGMIDSDRYISLSRINALLRYTPNNDILKKKIVRLKLLYKLYLIILYSLFLIIFIRIFR
jgi:hypothetical protein